MCSTYMWHLPSRLALAWSCYASVTGATHVTSYLPQSWFFDWEKPGESPPIRITEQCETLQIKMKSPNPPGPSYKAPYYMQIYTSTFTVPIIVPFGSSLTFNWTMPFLPDTQYQICMFDSMGNTGGCQATYTVIPARTSVNCSNVTHPPALDVSPEVHNGLMSQYEWVDKCTDIKLTPKNGTPPYTLTVAPALRPPYNVTSPDMKPIKWTVSLDYGMPFFISLVDAKGSMWAHGPLHAAVGGTLDCLVTSQASDRVKPAVAIGVGLGGLALGLLVGILGAWLFLKGQCKKKLKSTCIALPSRVSSPHGSPLDIDDGQGTSVMYQPTTSSLGMLARSLESPVGSFTMPGENHTRHVYEPQFRTPEYAPISATQPAPSSQVYVVHRDNQRSPITLYHTDGGSHIVELPPSYPPSPSGQRAALSDVSSSSPSRTGEVTSDVETIPPERPLEPQRRPGQIRKNLRRPS